MNEANKNAAQNSGQNEILAKNFLAALFKSEKEGAVNIWTFEGKESFWFSTSEIESAAQTAVKLGRQRNVFFGMGLREEGLSQYVRGTIEQVMTLGTAWVELDTDGGLHAAENLPSEEEARTLLDTFPLEPSIINHSGGGLHCYWLLKVPFRSSTEDMQSAKDLLSRFQSVFIRMAQAKGWHVDNTSSLEHVLRVPGTYNRKEGGAVLVQTKLFEPDRRYTKVKFNRIGPASIY